VHEQTAGYSLVRTAAWLSGFVFTPVTLKTPKDCVETTTTLGVMIWFRKIGRQSILTVEHVNQFRSCPATCEFTVVTGQCRLVRGSSTRPNSSSCCLYTSLGARYFYRNSVRLSVELVIHAYLVQYNKIHCSPRDRGMFLFFEAKLRSPGFKGLPRKRQLIEALFVKSHNLINTLR